MEEKDIPVVAQLHTSYIPGALLPKLGDDFMRSLYRVMLNLDEAATYVWEEDGKVLGFITATTNSGKLMKKALGKNFFKFAYSAFKFVVANPLRIKEVWETVTYSGRVDIPGVDGELLFIALEKEIRRMNVSDKMVTRCMDWLNSKGHKKVKVTTHATNRGANTLLQRLGFKLEKSLVFRGDEINLYVRAIRKNKDLEKLDQPQDKPPGAQKRANGDR